jgi:hypothetical protein
MPHADEALGRTYSHDHTTADRTGPLTNDEHDGFMEIALSATPATPASGKMRIYAQDASGVARLRALHSTGSDLAFFRDSVVRVRNTSGGTINKGELVYLSGATGNTPTVAKAKGDSAATMPAVGMLTTNTTNNSFGTVQFFGELTGLDTSAFVDGDRLFLSASTAGAVTATEPMHPNFSQPIGIVTKSGAGDGRVHLFTTLTHEGDDSGTNRAAYKIGPGSGAGAVDLQFVTGTTNTLYGKPTTVGALPVGIPGDRAFVTDALGPVFGAVVVGGGAVGVPVYADNAAAWRVG